MSISFLTVAQVLNVQKLMSTRKQTRGATVNHGGRDTIEMSFPELWTGIHIPMHDKEWSVDRASLFPPFLVELAFFQ